MGMIKKVICMAVAAVAAVGFTACDFSSLSSSETKQALTIQDIYETWTSEEGNENATFDDFLKQYLSVSIGRVDSPSVEDIYAAWLTVDGNSGSFNEFLAEYLSVDGEENETDVVSHNLMSSVSIFCGFTITTSTSYLPGRLPQTASSVASSAGSGVIWSLDKSAGDAYIVTNYHVVYDKKSNEKISDNIFVYLYGGMYGISVDNTTLKFSGANGAMKASYVGGSMTYDIAVLKIEDDETLKNSCAEKVSLGSSDSLVPNQKTIAIGNPKAEGMSLTTGVISVPSEYITMTAADDQTQVSFRVIRTDAAVNPGNSGGGMYNVYGELIGIVNAKNIENEVEGMCYALPIDNVKRVVDNILDNGGIVKRAYLGVTVGITSSEAVRGDNGLQIKETCTVSEVEAGGAAYGKLKSGDVITGVKIGDGERINITRQYQILDLLLDVRKYGTNQNSSKLTIYYCRGSNEESSCTISYLTDVYFKTIS